MTAKLPILFVSHGAPLVLLEDNAYTQALGALGRRLPRPAAVVAISAHWQTAAPVRVTTADQPPQIYDFDGFPPATYAVSYTPRGDVRLGETIVDRLLDAGIDARADARHGIDHGAWVPLTFAYPGAPVPVLQGSVPIAPPADLVAYGAALAPLRDAGILIVASGGIVHNLRRLRFEEDGATPDPWAVAFDDWVWEQVRSGRRAELLAYVERAPHADLAVPTTEHLDPLFVALGAWGTTGNAAEIHAGFRYGSLSMRTFLLED